LTQNFNEDTVKFHDHEVYWQTSFNNLEIFEKQLMSYITQQTKSSSNYTDLEEIYKKIKIF